MARSFWNGSITFGLVSVPVSLLSSKSADSLSFRLLDRRDEALVGYRPYNKSTGEVLPKTEIVKGFEYEPDRFVVVTEDDFRRANPHATRTIAIENFVSIAELDPLLFETPYFLVPGANGERGYALLKRAMEATRKSAVGRIVVHNKQHLAAVVPRGRFLVLEILRFEHEIQGPSSTEYLQELEGHDEDISLKELKMAESLIQHMTTPWEPSGYRDTYQEDLLKLIKQKVKAGASAQEVSEPATEAQNEASGADLSPLLERSLAAAPAPGVSRVQSLVSPGGPPEADDVAQSTSSV